MTLYPDVQKAAQAELDALLGGERLPDFGDKTRLPYVTAILKEVLRWIPVLPMGEYEPGFLIYTTQPRFSRTSPSR